jgi:hypothetical protein
MTFLKTRADLDFRDMKVIQVLEALLKINRQNWVNLLKEVQANEKH